MGFAVPLFQRSTIKSDEGFEIRLLTWDLLHYADKELVLSVGIDTGAGVVSLMYKAITQIAPRPWGETIRRSGKEGAD